MIIVRLDARPWSEAVGGSPIAGKVFEWTYIQTQSNLFRSDRLAGKQLCHGLQRVNLRCRLVPANANNPGKAQRIPTLVPARFLDVVECYFKHDRRRDGTSMPMILNRVLQEEIGVFANLRVSYTRIARV